MWWRSKEQIYRTTPATVTGAPCIIEEMTTQQVDCNTQICPVPCVGTGADWSECSVECGGGTQTRTYTITNSETMTDGGEACSNGNGEIETQVCNDQACPIDCEGHLEDWSSCPCPPDDQIQFRNFIIDRPGPFNGGERCSYENNGIQNTIEATITQI